MADETPMSDERLEELRRVGEPHPSGKFHLLGVEELVRENARVKAKGER